MGTEEAERQLRRLLDVMARLRDPARGCPWDQVQTFATIAPYTVEEAYEVADAIAREDVAALPDELGDLLLQVVYHARMAEEAGLFGFADVARLITDKMVRRHPHVFGDAEAVPGSWEAQKQAERLARAEGGTLAGVPRTLPALTRAASSPPAPPASASTGRTPPPSSTSSTRKPPSCARNSPALIQRAWPTRSATCCSSWRTSPASSGLTPKRASAAPTPSSRGASNRSSAVLPIRVNCRARHPWKKWRRCGPRRKRQKRRSNQLALVLRRS